MIGNDIVDLAHARRESNWRRRGYLDKIFTPREQQLIHSARDPNQLVWLLWSMKESAYKLAVRRTGNRVFAPSKIACHLSEPASETVTGDVFYNEAYRTESVITSQYISTVAFAASAMPRYTQVIVPFETMDYRTHQFQIRQTINEYTSRLFSTAGQPRPITKNSLGVPFLTDSTGQPIPISISHHGHFGAFVIGLP